VSTILALSYVAEKGSQQLKAFRGGWPVRRSSVFPLFAPVSTGSNTLWITLNPTPFVSIQRDAFKKRAF
jgi:hypothetical protein